MPVTCRILPGCRCSRMRGHGQTGFEAVLGRGSGGGAVLGRGGGGGAVAMSWGRWHVVVALLGWVMV